MRLSIWITLSPSTLLQFFITHCYWFLYSFNIEQTESTLKSSIFWDITPCSPLKVNQRFGGTCRLQLQGQRISRARNQSESMGQTEQNRLLLRQLNKGDCYGLSVQFGQMKQSFWNNFWWISRSESHQLEDQYVDKMILNKEFWEELIAYFPWYDKGHIENDASNNLLLLRVHSLPR
jgi:hypothetical protein